MANQLSSSNLQLLLKELLQDGRLYMTLNSGHITTILQPESLSGKSLLESMDWHILFHEHVPSRAWIAILFKLNQRELMEACNWLDLIL